MKPLETDRLTLRAWEERDRPFFHRLNSDETIMEFFPFRRNRAQADGVMDLMNEEIARSGFGFTAAEIRETGELIGFVGLHETAELPGLSSGTVEIGWRLAPEFWGKGFATEGARAWLNHGFGPLGLEEIVSFAVAGNKRSTAVMERIGMTRDNAGEFDHPSVPETHPHLKRHVLYRLTRLQWQAPNRGRH